MWLTSRVFEGEGITLDTLREVFFTTLRSGLNAILLVGNRILNQTKIYMRVVWIVWIFLWNWKSLIEIPKNSTNSPLEILTTDQSVQAFQLNIPELNKKKQHFSSKKKSFNFPALWSARSSGCHFHCFAVECSFALGSSHYTLFSYYCRPRRIDCAQQLYQKGSHTNQIRLTGSVALEWILQNITFLLILFIFHVNLFWLKNYHKCHLISVF